MSTLTRAGPAEDERTLAVAAKSDRAAFGVLYDRYVHRVYGYCARRLRTPEDAEDATSRVFTRALAAMPRYREDGPSFGAWLFAIAHNVVVDEWRARQGGGHATPWIENVAATVDAALDPEESTLIAEEVREVRTLLSRLPADQAQLIELRLAGLTDKEIAFVLGRSHGAVRVAQYRAIRRLRGLLGIGPLSQESRDA